MQCLFCLLVCSFALFFLMPASLRAQSSDPESQALSDSEKAENAREEEKSLSTLLQAQQEFLKEQQSQVESLEKNLPQVLSSLSSQTESLSSRLNILIRLKGFIKQNYRALAVLNRNVSQLQQNLQQALQPVNTAQGDLESLYKRVQDKQEDIRKQLSISPRTLGEDQARQEMAQIRSMLDRIEELQLRLKKGREPVHELESRVQEFEKLLNQDQQQSWKKHFLKPSFTLFKLNPGEMKAQFSEWKQELPVYWHLFVLGNFNWALFLLQALGLFSLFCIASLVLVAIIKRRNRDGMPLKRMLPPPLFISLALAILVTNTYFQSSFQFLIFQILSQLILGWGLILLLWLIRFSMVDASEFCANPLRLLWFPFAFSLVLQNVILPTVLTELVWIFLLAIFIAFFKRHKTKIDVKLERVLHRITIFLFIFFILMTLAGWVHMSLLLTSLWFVFCICLQVGNCITGMLWHKTRQFPENTLGFLGRGLVQGAGVPILWLFSFSIVVLWLGMTLGDFQFLRELSKLKLGWTYLSISIFRLLIVFIGFYLARSGLVVLKSMLQSAAALHSSLDSGTVGSFNVLMTYGVWSLFIILALAFLGLDLTSLSLVAGGLSVGIGFGLQSIFNNFISGIIVLFSRSIQPGDVIQAQGLWAEVKNINSLTTEVQTYERSTILMPNSKLISEEITNWTHRHDKTLRRKVRVRVAYGTDTELVRSLLMNIADTHPRILKSPSAFVRFADFGDSSLAFTLYFYASIDYGWLAESDLRYDINKIFQEYGIIIAFPQRDIHLRSLDGLEALASRLGLAGESKAEGKEPKAEE